MLKLIVNFLLKKSKSVKEVRPSLDECVLKEWKEGLLDWSRPSCKSCNLAEGHPPEVATIIFKSNLVCHVYFQKPQKMENKIINVPEEIDKQVAVDALKAMDVKIDKLTPEQIKYANSW